MALWNEWSGLKRLLALKAAGIIGSGASWAWDIVTGAAPISLPSAIAKGIKRLIQYGKTTQSTTPTPSSPQDIVINNGVVRYGALGSNLCDPSAANTVLECYINKADGEVKPSPLNFMFAGYMPVVPGKKYVAYGRAKVGNDLSDYNRVAWYDSGKNWLSGADYTQNRISVVTAPANAAYARFSCNPTGATTVTQELVDSYNWMFAEGTAEISPFIPFEGGILVDGTDEVLTVRASGADSQTASVADLYSVGDYADEQDIISGAVTHKCGVKVFDGSEEWQYSTNGYTFDWYDSSIARSSVVGSQFVWCTHFRSAESAPAAQSRNGYAILYNTGTPSNRIGCGYNAADKDVDTWKAFLASQYAAGTPVIVLYPLAESTTESVTAQHLSTAVGDNTVSVVSNVDPVDLEVEYAKAVST